MRKHELAGYLVALVSIMESKESAGLARGSTLAEEYNRTYDEFIKALKEEHDYEARKREEHLRAKNPTRGEGSLAGGSEPDWYAARRQSGTLPRPGVSGPDGEGHGA